MSGGLSQAIRRGLRHSVLADVVEAPPRWTRCSVDQQLHLVASAGEGETFAVCGRRIVAEGLTLSGESRGLCVSCLAAGE